MKLPSLSSRTNSCAAVRGGNVANVCIAIDARKRVPESFVLRYGGVFSVLATARMRSIFSLSGYSKRVESISNDNGRNLGLPLKLRFE